MDETAAIEAITNLETLRYKRSARRGQITRLQKRVTSFLAEDLRSTVITEVEHTANEVRRQIELESAIQLRLEILLTGQDGYEAELADGEAFEPYKTKLSTESSLAVSAMYAYGSLDAMEAEADSLMSVEDPTSPSHVRRVTELHQELNAIHKAHPSAVRDTRIQHIVKRTRDAIQKLLQEIDAATPRSSFTAPAPSTSQPLHAEHSLKIDLPRFDGNTLGWHTFRKMFESVLHKRGRHLSDVEKLTLLIGALDTKDGRDHAQLHSFSGTDFNSALTALEEKYGKTSVVYPELVGRILTPIKYDYSTRGFQDFYKHIVQPYRHLQQIKKIDLSMFLTQLAENSFSQRLKEEWRRYKDSSEKLPTIDDFETFTKKRAAEVSTEDKKRFLPSSSDSPTPSTANSKPKQLKSSGKCPVCEDKHSIARCLAFMEWDVERRNKYAREKKLCLNCLGEGHQVRQCSSKYSCRTCRKKHHSLLHIDRQDEPASRPPAVLHVRNNASAPDQDFLETVQLTASSDARHAVARAILDTGACTSFITEALASQLQLPRSPADSKFVTPEGEFTCKHTAQVELSSLVNPKSKISTSCYVVPKLPHMTSPENKTKILEELSAQNLCLADPNLGGPVDILLGNRASKSAILSAPKQHLPLQLSLTNTLFGWTVSGPAFVGNKSPALMVHSKTDELNLAFTSLWELDMVKQDATLSPEDQRAVDSFKNSHSIAEDGRFMVKLPKKEDAPPLGDSRRQAITRFLANERSLLKKGKLSESEAVLREYVSLGHAEKIPPHQLHDEPKFYLPIQVVFKDSSTTTKCRPVFDASAITTSGHSLNDTLLTGPNLYPLLSDVLLRFRSHKIAFSADISKMFREIWLHPEDRDLHRFFMRDGDGRLAEFRMTRLTFGVKTSPYIATQVLRQLADNHQETHPLAAKAIREVFYVDDFLSGAQDEEAAGLVRTQLADLLSKAGMTLRKWRASSAAFLEKIPEELREEADDLELVSPAQTKKALGIHWNAQADVLHISTPVDTSYKKLTKKVIASVTAKVYDVLGFFAPALIPAKALMQSLWKTNLNWDKEVPEEIKTVWDAWTVHLPHITKHSIHRRYDKYDSPVIFTALHGFSDASTVAYGAVVYLRQLHQDGQVTTSLVSAKARVLPLKPLTIPRAELTAALLLSKLMAHVAQLLEVSESQLYAWTDSAIVIHWLNTPPHKLNVFVGNRVVSITKNVDASHWRHVRSKENPADLASRGCYAEELIQSKLWWSGPEWLSKSPEQWPPLLDAFIKNPPEVKKVVLSIVSPPPSFVKKFSSFFTLLKVVAWLLRFSSNCKLPRSERTLSTHLGPGEATRARNLLYALAQQEEGDVVQAIKQGKPIAKKSALARYKMSATKEGVLQVECRVRNVDKKPKLLIYLPIKSVITRMFVDTLHTKLGHPGTSALMAIISDSYLIPGLRNYVKSLSKQCTKCQKAYQQTKKYEMGLLPQARTKPAPPFAHVGVDFAGPLTMKSDRQRKPIYLKIYVAVFICLTTKAVHLDICRGLSTEEFMATLRRFTNRRGTPEAIYSDNGSNFVGAKREIKEVMELLRSTTTNDAIVNFSTVRDLRWHQIPPRAPHFGGLWESAVRRMKVLLRKLSPHPLTYDELYTILTEAESILNSTPLTDVNADDVLEDTILTPGHFLIGRPMKALPNTTDTPTSKISSLRRWRLIQRYTQELWERWTKSYLQSLYHRSKWSRSTPNVEEGEIVYIKDESLPYRTWPIAKVTKVFPGSDGVVRTVELLCNGRRLTRAVNRLIPCVKRRKEEKKDEEDETDDLLARVQASPGVCPGL